MVVGLVVTAVVEVAEAVVVGLDVEAAMVMAVVEVVVTACATTLFTAEGGKSPDSIRGLEGSTWLASLLHASRWLWVRFFT